MTFAPAPSTAGPTTRRRLGDVVGLGSTRPRRPRLRPRVRRPRQPPRRSSSPRRRRPPAAARRRRRRRASRHDAGGQHADGQGGQVRRRAKPHRPRRAPRRRSDLRHRARRPGRSRSAPTARTATPCSTSRPLVRAGGEQGLLGLAFHPTEPLAYVDYTGTDGGNTHIAEFAVAADGTIDPDSRRELLEIDQPYANHNGGQLAFGPDGMLYIGMGDGGSGGDPERRALERRRAARQDPADRPDTERRPAVHHPGGQPVRRHQRRPPGDLVRRRAQPVAVQLRPVHRRPVDRRRRPEPVGGGRRRLGRRGRGPRRQLRVERVRGHAPVQRRPADAGRGARRSSSTSTTTRAAARSAVARCTGARRCPASTAGTSTATTASATCAPARSSTAGQVGR